MTPDWMTSLDDGFAEGVVERIARRWVGGRQGEGVGGGSAAGPGVPRDAGTPNAGSGVEATGTSVAASLSALTSTREIFNGFYTLVLPDGGHKTFRVHTQKLTSKFAPGRRVVGLLVGPENTSDYEGVGFLEAGGIRVWKRFVGSRVEVHCGILWELMGGGTVEGCEILVSRRCLVCNRTLSEPESIASGIGPTCQEKLKS